MSIHRDVAEGKVILSSTEKRILRLAGSQRVERRIKNAHAFDRLTELGLLEKGKCTIEGGRTIRILKRLQ